MKDKDLLLEAIDHYGLLSPSAKALLKKLIELQQDNEVIIDMADLIKFLGNSRPTISINLRLLVEHNFIEVDLKQGKKLRSIFIKPQRLTKIIDHYLPKKDLK